jgi:hypothetical protein
VLLKRTLDTGKSNAGNGGYLQLKNVRFDTASGRWLVNEAPLDENRVYKVVMPEFLLTGNEQNMGFLKCAPGAPAEGISKIVSGDPNDPDDVRSDIRKALIRYWKQQ